MVLGHGTHEDGVELVSRRERDLGLRGGRWLVMLETERERERERDSTGNSLTVLHSVFLSFIMAAIFSSVGKAIAPAVAAIYSGDSAASPSNEQNSLVNACAASAHARSGSANSRA